MLNYFSVYFRLVLIHWYDKMMRPGSAATCWKRTVGVKIICLFAPVRVCDQYIAAII